MAEPERRPDRLLGPVHDDFWAYAAQGELRLQRCGGCGRLAWPAVKACDHCGSGDLAWELLSGRGRIASWCEFHQDYYRGLFPVPYTTILVELDEGALFVSDPEGFGYEEIEAGMPVAVRFRDCEDKAGPFKLPVFARA